jgi:hypothetical protein
VVDSAQAEWLQSPARLTDVTDVAFSARWGVLAGTATATSAIAAEADAIVEGGRHLAFVAGPIVEERVFVGGLLPIDELRGACHSITVAGDPNYQGGAMVYVLGGGRDYSVGTSYLDVLRRL